MTAPFLSRWDRQGERDRPAVAATSNRSFIRMDQPRCKFQIQFSNSREKTVIASAAKQSMAAAKRKMDCFAALAMTVNKLRVIWLFEKLNRHFCSKCSQ